MTSAFDDLRPLSTEDINACIRRGQELRSAYLANLFQRAGHGVAGLWSGLITTRALHLRHH